ncbi:segregation/condensation protein A [bacterium]|nr:segregation/condensation protein A [bacterium]
MAYKVKLNVFEGPFDLLLHLVRVNEMDIYDIPIAEITRQYLGFISDMEKLDLDVAGDFLVMAATLINIKSRTLMPPVTKEEAEEEAEEEIDEEFESIRNAQDLMRRLIEYRQFKEMAVELSGREEEQLRLFYRNSVLPRLTEKGAPEGLKEDISLLFSAFARVLEYAEGRPTHRVLEEEFSVEEKIELLRDSLALRKRLNIHSLFVRCLNKQEVITLFLALLEMCRMRQVRVIQKKNYQDIYLVHPSEPEEDDDEED